MQEQVINSAIAKTVITITIGLLKVTSVEILNISLTYFVA